MKRIHSFIIYAHRYPASRLVGACRTLPEKSRNSLSVPPHSPGGTVHAKLAEYMRNQTAAPCIGGVDGRKKPPIPAADRAGLLEFDMGTEKTGVIADDLASICYPFDALEQRRDAALSALSGLSSEKLSAINRLFIWMSNSNPSDEEVMRRMRLVFKGDTGFAALILEALHATGSAPMQAAND